MRFWVEMSFYSNLEALESLYNENKTGNFGLSIRAINRLSLLAQRLASSLLQPI